MKTQNTITVLGAGSWGTALALHLAHNANLVHLWGHDPAFMQTLARERCNTKFLPGFQLPDNLALHATLSEALAASHTILIAVPSHAFRKTLIKIKPFVTPQTHLCWATKGLDSHKHQLLHEIVAEVLGDLPSGIISGPSFAKEVAAGLPTAITVAANSPLFAKDLQQLFHNKTFRVYTSNDIVGVELGGAMKNVLAIAVGIADGLQFGANARSALITRGLAEMIRLGLALGGRTETLMGLAGVGDLVLTCTDNQSRNRRFGLAVGGGQNIVQAEKTIGQTVEGINTSSAIFHLARQVQVEVPICEQVYRVLHEGISPLAAVNALMNREPREEGI